MSQIDLPELESSKYYSEYIDTIEFKINNDSIYINKELITIKSYNLDNGLLNLVLNHCWIKDVILYKNYISIIGSKEHYDEYGDILFYEQFNYLEIKP